MGGFILFPRLKVLILPTLAIKQNKAKMAEYFIQVLCRHISIENRIEVDVDKAVIMSQVIQRNETESKPQTPAM